MDNDLTLTAEPERIGLERFVALAPMTHVDVRDPSQNPDNTWTFSGYAAVYNQRAIVKNASDFRLEYEIAPDAFADVLTTQNLAAGDGVVHFNLNHNMDSVIAASDVPWGQPGSLKLSSDAHGLHYLVKASRDDPDAVKLAVKLRDGVIRQASVAFVCGDHQITQSDSGDGTEVVLRRITQASQLVDVCATPQGVFHQASSQLQQFAANIFGQPGAVALGGHPRHPDQGGVSSVSPEASGGVAAPAKPRLSAATMSGVRRHRRAA